MRAPILVLLLACLFCAFLSLPAVSAESTWSRFGQWVKGIFVRETPATGKFVLSDTEALATSSNAMSSAQIWDAYRTELFNFLKRGTDTSSLQLLMDPAELSYDASASTQTLGALMNRVSKSGLVYAPQAGRSLPAEYEAFLKALKLDGKGPSAADLAKLEEAKQRLESAKTTHEEYESKCRTRFFGSYTCRVRTCSEADFASYARMSCGSLEFYRLSVSQAQMQVTALESSLQGPNADALRAIENLDANDGSFAWDEAMPNALRSFRAAAAGGRAASFAIQVSRQSASQSQSQAEFAQSFVEPVKSSGSSSGSSTTTSSSTSKFEFSTDNSQFRMSIEADGLATITVRPGDWFDRSVVARYSNGPFADPKKSAAFFFGPNGRVPALPRTMYALYNPRASLTLAKADALKLEELSKQGSFKLGPFVVESLKLTKIATPSGSSSSTTTTTTTTSSSSSGSGSLADDLLAAVMADSDADAVAVETTTTTTSTANQVEMYKVDLTGVREKVLLVAIDTERLI